MGNRPRQQAPPARSKPGCAAPGIRSNLGHTAPGTRSKGFILSSFMTLHLFCVHTENETEGNDIREQSTKERSLIENLKG